MEISYINSSKYLLTEIRVKHKKFIFEAIFATL